MRAKQASMDRSRATGRHVETPTMLALRGCRASLRLYCYSYLVLVLTLLASFDPLKGAAGPLRVGQSMSIIAASMQVAVHTTLLL